MMPYRFKRRAFLGSIGGAVGLKILLQNLEAQAMGATSPPRFLMMHWPVGIVRAKFMPTGSGTTYTASPILQPFETAGLREDMIVLTGLSHNGISSGNGGGHESGTPMTTTGSNCPGTRDNQGEDDDGCAGGPSWDQILLKNVPNLQTPGAGYVNAICDARIDSFETSTQCLSYSYTKRSIASARPGGMIQEATPLLPTLSPVQLFMNLFGTFMPGEPGTTDETVLKALYAKKSVLDYAMRELATIKTLAPGSEAAKIDFHTEAIRKIEMSLSDQLANPIGSSMGCMVPAAPDPELLGKTGSRFDYTNPQVNGNESDEELHKQIGFAHAGIIMAAFQCDIIRVATFQWSPGTNHVSFKGMYPDNTNAIYMHHPLTHRIADTGTWNGAIPGSGENHSIMEFTAAVQTWYNAQTAEILNRFKMATDSFGNSLLAHTVIPYVTEVAEPAHSRSPLAAMIFGGSALGMQGGQYQHFNQVRSINDMWLSAAQAFFQTDDPLGAIRANETPTFVTNNVGPIDGLWAPPA